MSERILSRYYAIKVANAIRAIYDVLDGHIMKSNDDAHLRSSQRRLFERLSESHTAMNAELWRLTGKDEEGE